MNIIVEDMIVESQTQNSVAFYIVYGSVWDVIVKSHWQTSIATYIVKSTMGDVIVKSYKQNILAINFMESNKEIDKGHMQHSVLSNMKG